jgi:hypothetical protein
MELLNMSIDNYCNKDIVSTRLEKIILVLDRVVSILETEYPIVLERLRQKLREESRGLSK